MDRLVVVVAGADAEVGLASDAGSGVAGGVRVGTGSGVAGGASCGADWCVGCVRGGADSWLSGAAWQPQMWHPHIYRRISVPIWMLRAMGSWNGDLFHDLEAKSVNPWHGFGMIAHDAQPPQAQITQDLATDTEFSLVHRLCTRTYTCRSGEVG